MKKILLYLGIHILTISVITVLLLGGKVWPANSIFWMFIAFGAFLLPALLYIPKKLTNKLSYKKIIIRSFVSGLLSAICIKLALVFDHMIIAFILCIIFGFLGILINNKQNQSIEAIATTPVD